MNAGASVARIALEIPERPTNRDLLIALVKAEQAGFERAMGFDPVVQTLERIRERVTKTFEN